MFKKKIIFLLKRWLLDLTFLKDEEPSNTAGRSSEERGN
jgi:hypothetical protein